MKRDLSFVTGTRAVLLHRAAAVCPCQLNAASMNRHALLMIQGPVLPEQWKPSLYQRKT